MENSIDKQAWRLLTENTSDIVLVVDRNNRIIYINKILEVWHIIADDILGKKITTFLNDSDAEKLKSRLDEVYDKKQSVSFLTQVTFETTKVWLGVKVIPAIEEGKIIGSIIIANNVTQRIDENERTELNQNLNNNLFTMNPMPIGLTKFPSGKIERVNPAFLELIGYTGNENLVGKSTLDIDMWVDKRERNILLSELKEKRSIREREIEIKDFTGGVKNCLTSATIIEFKGLEYVLFILLDITKRAQREANLLRDVKEPLFKMGDEVWAIAQDMFDIKVKCGFCGGDGKAEGHDKNEIICPICEGHGSIVEDTEIKWKVIRKFTIAKTTTTSELKNGKNVSKVIYHYADNAFSENQCFSSEEAAIATCDRLNNDMLLDDSII